MKIISLGMEQSYCGIVELYNRVAQVLGYEDTDNLHYDCKSIDVAPNVADNIFAYMEKEEGRDKFAQGMLWVCYGPKANDKLNDDEVMVYDDFITEVEV